MPSKLAGKTIILTGSSVVGSARKLVEENAGQVKHFPLIETVEKINADDAEWLARLVSFDWLIFTSQNAVTCFLAKCIRHHVDYAKLPQKIAAVGEKTAQGLRNAGLAVHFMPTTYSADVFVQQFRMASEEHALFLRGSMAKSTIHDGTGAEEWTVYETEPCLRHLDALERCLIESAEPIVVFASPSAVNVYAQHIAPDFDWSFIKIASIGHVTTAILETYGVVPHVQPQTYTMQAVIEQLILEESS